MSVKVECELSFGFAAGCVAVALPRRNRLNHSWGCAPLIDCLNGAQPQVQKGDLRQGKPCLTSGGEADRTKSLPLSCGHYM